MGKCTIEINNFFDLCKKVRLPKYQRNIVWKREQRISLIDTIRKGYPFGTILLYKNKERYEIIDGLQRYFTITDFIKNRKNYYKDDFLKNIIDRLEMDFFIRNKRAITGDEKQQFIDEIWETFQCCQNSYKYADSLKSRLEKQLIVFSDDLYGLCKYVFSEFDNDLNVKTIELPILIYEGKADDLPEIFEKINTTGTKLTRFDTFSAMWNKYTYEITDVEILKEVEKRYESIIENSGLEIEGYEPGSITSSKRINLYEYCWAFSKIIENRFNKLINAKSEGTIGFYLLAACIKKSTINMEIRLPGFFGWYDNPEYPEFINKAFGKIKECIIKCIEIVEEILNQNFKYGNINGFNYNEYQFVTIVATLFNLQYSLTSKDLGDGNFDLIIKDIRSKNTSKLQDFIKYMPKIYLYEQIKNVWTGNFSTRINDVLTKPMENNPYLNKITKEQMAQAIKDWQRKEDEKEKSLKVSSRTKLFLSYIFTKKVVLRGAEDFIIAPIIPTKRLKEVLISGNFSNLGNISIYPKFREYKDKMYYEYNKLPDKYYEQMLYPNEEEIKIFTNKTFSRANYRSFFIKRKNMLIETFLDAFTA